MVNQSDFEIRANNLAWLESWGCSVIERDEYLVVISRDFPNFNGAQVKEAGKWDIESTIDRACKEFLSRGYQPQFVIDSRESGLLEYLDERRFREIGELEIMARMVHSEVPEPAAKFRIERMKSDQIITWAELYSGARNRKGQELEMDLKRWTRASKSEPQLRFYLALQNELPVGCAQLMVTPKAGGIYSVSVSEAFRGLGIGRALIFKMLYDSVRLEIDQIYLVNEKEGDDHDYRRLHDYYGAAGFATHHTYKKFVEARTESR